MEKGLACPEHVSPISPFGFIWVHLKNKGMSKIFVVKMPARPQTGTGEYVVVTCPKCGKKTYGVAGQKGKKCPVCRRQYAMPDDGGSTRFKTPDEACRYIQAEEAKRAGRMDFAPVSGGFRPAACAPVIARTNKVVSEAKTLDAQFATWARAYFSSVIGDNHTGIPAAVVIAGAAKAGFVGADKLLEKGVTSGLLTRPKPYTVWLAKLE